MTLTDFSDGTETRAQSNSKARLAESELLLRESPYSYRARDPRINDFCVCGLPMYCPEHADEYTDWIQMQHTKEDP